LLFIFCLFGKKQTTATTPRLSVNISTYLVVSQLKSKAIATTYLV